MVLYLMRFASVVKLFVLPISTRYNYLEISPLILVDCILLITLPTLVYAHAHHPPQV